MAMVALTKYHITWYMIEDVKAFLDQIRREWETNDDEILRIMQIHAFHGKRLVIIFAGFAYPSVCMVVLYHISPIILDKILPLNESRSIKYLISAEFFINKEQHQIISICLLHFFIIIDATVFVGTESLMIMISSHIAGLFEVARFVRDLNNLCNMSYGPAIIFGVIALSSHFFCLSQTVFRPADSRDTILSVFLINSTLGYMFCINFAAGNMISTAESIPLTTYNTNWYETSIPTQKLLQLIILNSNRGFKFSILSVYVPSVEGFAMLLKASVSYFTVLLSLQ
ncbi:odorant receptor 43a-like [Megachile rotundata]|uniref:odorant receptor 43a-like n=1 Tax=Megachile rotundata TaxID=143995 RepID=UPI003FD4BCFA